MRIFLIFILCSFNAFAQTSTILQILAGDSVLNPSTGLATFTDNGGSGDADGSSETDAMVGYYPIDVSSGTGIHAESTIFSTSAGHPLPRVNRQGGTNAVMYSNNPFINFRFKHTYTTVKRVYVFWKPSSGDYIRVQPLNYDTLGDSYYVSASPNTETNILIKLQDVCTVSTSGCYAEFNALLDTGSSSEIVQASQMFYLYVVDSPTTSNTTMNPANNTIEGSLFVKLRFSSTVPTPAPTLNSLNLARGDTQLTVNYSTSINTSADGLPAYTMVLKTISTVTDGSTFFDANGGALVGPCIGDVGANATCYILNPYQQNGSITVSNLTNNVTYLLTPAHVSKFKFVSRIPTNGTGRPQEIQAFIKEQNCFFLSAGFGDHHFVLDYMRNFRDSVLLKYRLGKFLVNFYYQTAPQYTPYIYNSPFVASLMRILGYSLYYCLNLWLVLFSAMTALLAFVRFKKFL